MMPDTAPDLSAVARRYYEAGLAVVPPRNDGSKRPFPNQWQQFQQARPTPRQIKEWYSNGLTGIGTICGAVSGNLELFEFDHYATYLAFMELAHETDLEELVERIRLAYTESTPGGGIHWYYRCETISGNTKLASKPDGSTVKVLIETRGEGGYSVMAPSYGTVHPNNTPYEVVCGAVENIVTITPEERDALWQLARSFDEMPVQEGRPDAPGRPSDGDRPGDRYNQSVTWADVLQPHGWKRVYRKGETTYWRRPGKDIGISATTNHTGNDTLIVFSSSTPFETSPASYNKFAAFAILNHRGNFTTAGRVLWEQGYRDGATGSFGGQQQQAPPRDDVDPETGEVKDSLFIDWPTFWATDHLSEDWLLEPIIPRGRSISLYAGAKTGKSLLTLDLIARLATGSVVLRRTDPTPVRIVYLDLEMTESDLRERLEEMGYGPDVDLSNLYYAMLPSLPPLDTVQGGEALKRIVTRVAAQLVVIDTTSRVISGEENSADTMRAFYAQSVLPLKALGITVMRLDHAGKDPTKGQRGTSAKADDVDLVWELSIRDGGLRLHATHRRQSWVPEFVNLKRLEDPLRHEVVEDSWPSGTAELAEQLDALGVSLNATNRQVRDILKSNGIKVRGAVLSAAIRYRRNRETPRETSFENEWRNTSGDKPETEPFEPGNTPGNTGNTEAREGGKRFPPIRGKRSNPEPETGEERWRNR